MLTPEIISTFRNTIKDDLTRGTRDRLARPDMHCDTANWLVGVIVDLHSQRTGQYLGLARDAGAEAQGEGPRVYTLAPVDFNAVSVTYMDLSSNANFAGNIAV